MTVVTNINYEEEKREKKDEKEELEEKEEEDKEWQMGGGFNAGTMQAKMGERRDKGGRPVNLPSLKRPPPRVSCLCHILSVTAPSFDGINIGKICQPPFVETTPFADHIPSQEVLFSLYFWIKERDLSPNRPFQEYIFIFTLPMILALLCSIPLSISKSEH